MNDRTTALVDNGLEILVYLVALSWLAYGTMHGQPWQGELNAMVGVLLGRGVRGILSPRPNSVAAQQQLQPAVVAAPTAAAPTGAVIPAAAVATAEPGKG
ncbi:MAG: hypothetical protein JWM53_3802 [bacterium]|nr:hypothetical protein [bacterium]